MSIETLVSEVARATGLGQNAQKFVGVVARYIFSQPGGLAGFRNKFEAAGLGRVFNSWLSGRESPMQSIEPNQLRSVLGNQSVEEIAQKSGIGAKMIPGLLATAVPAIVKAVTAGGVMPTSLPAAFASLAGGSKVGKPSFRLWRWLLPFIALLALAWCGWQSRNVAKPPPAAAPAANVATVATDPTLSFQNTGGKVTVNGTLPTVAQKTNLEGALEGVFGKQNVNANLEVNPATRDAPWLERLKVLIPDMKADGLKFAFNGDKLNLDTSALAPEKREQISRVFQSGLGNVEIEGLFDQGTQALSALAPGANAADLTAALNKTTVNFDTGLATLTRSSEGILDLAATAIKRSKPEVKVEISGHTDSQGNAATNQQLSEQRAEAVRSALVKRGVPQAKLVARGFGSNQPMGDNSTEEGRKANRRIQYAAM
ncbi:OmpA family protein [Stenotrophomonas sp. PS02300]|uniref:OmpA family protein n=1 Tax=Stenotrophomonas sp. PS02300 TaxID=2991426 RepID=UPI00249A76A0|nr:OmpA family protein [Stenotrophomonas sp. PS02300]